MVNMLTCRQQKCDNGLPSFPRLQQQTFCQVHPKQAVIDSETRFFTNWSTKSTKSTRGDQDDDAEEEEDNAGPGDSLTSLVSLINMSHAHCKALCGVCRHYANCEQLVMVYEARRICSACMQYTMHCRVTFAM